MNQYSFQYSIQDDCGPNFPVAKTTQTNVQFHDEVTWDVVLTEFINFLSSVYGYDISRSVSFKSLDQKIAELSDKYDLEDEEPSSIDLDDDDELWRKIV